MPRGDDDYVKLRKTFELLEERYITPTLPQLPAERRANPFHNISNDRGGAGG
jgi:hypothetical protein